MRRLLLALLLIHTCTFLAPAVPNDTSPILRLGRGYMNAADFSPDDRWFATASQDGELNLWDNWDGSLVRHLAGHAGSVIGVRFSPDGHSLYSLGADATLRRWDVATGLQLLCHTYDPKPYSFDLNSSGTLLALAKSNGLIQICNPLSGDPLSTLTLLQGTGFKTIRFSAMGNYLLQQPWQWGIAYIIDTQGRTIWSADTVKGLVMAPDEASFFYCRYGAWYHCKLDGTVLQQQARATGNKFYGNLIGYLSRTNQLIMQYNYFANDASPQLINIDTLNQKALGGPKDEIVMAKLSNSGDMLQVASKDGHVWAWNTSELTLIRDFHPNSAYCQHAEFSPDSRGILLGTSDAVAEEYDLNGTLTSTYIPWVWSPRFMRQEAHYSDDGQLVGMATDEGNLCIWNAQSHALLHQQLYYGLTSFASHFVPNSHTFVSGFQAIQSQTLAFNSDTSATKIYASQYPDIFISSNTYLHFNLNYDYDHVQILKLSWPFGGGQQFALVPKDTVTPIRSAFSPDKKTLIICTYAGLISFIDIPSMTLTKTIRVGEASQGLQASFVKFLPDGQRFLIGWEQQGENPLAEQKEAELRDVRTGNLLQTFDPPGGDYCTGGDVSPDGQYAAIAQGGFTYLFRLPANAAREWGLYP